MILNLEQWFRKRCLLKIFLIWSSGRRCVQGSETICAILVEGIKRNNHLNHFEFVPVVQEEMSLKAISYLELWRPFCSVEQNHLCNFGRGHHEEHSCDVI